MVMEGKWEGRFPPKNVGKNRDKIGVSRGGVGHFNFFNVLLRTR